MSDLIEKLHQNIYTNLGLLKSAGHKIEFEKDMFKRRNQVGFESVGYALLMIIDPTECKRTIPWPLFDARTQGPEFRKNFVNFIKMINKKYPEAGIPEITASNLHFPSGENFLRLLYKLSSFTLKLELERNLDDEELKKLIPPPVPSKCKKVRMAKYKIIEGALCEAQAEICQYVEYEERAVPVLENMKTLNEHLAKCIDSAKEKLKSEVSDLKVDDEVKRRLMDVEDCDAINEYNQKTETKVRELEAQSMRLCQVRDVARGCLQQMEALSKSAHCLDGHKLDITPALSELTEGPVVNTDGDVKLLAVLQAGLAAAEKLAPSSPVDASYLSQAKDLLDECQQLQNYASKIGTSLDEMCSESTKVIEELRPIMHARMREKELPSFLECMKAQPLLNFNTPKVQRHCSKVKSPSKKVKKNAILPHVIKKLKSITISKKGKYHTLDSKKCHKSLFKTPICKRRPTSRLSSIKRQSTDRKKLITSSHATEVLAPSTSQASYTQEQEIVKDKPSTSIETALSITENTTSQPRSNRKSLEDIIKRYVVIKEKMDNDANKNDKSSK